MNFKWVDEACWLIAWKSSLPAIKKMTVLMVDRRLIMDAALGGLELFNSLKKNERVHGTRHETRDVTRAKLFEHIEVFCNRDVVRRHLAVSARRRTSNPS